jgi:hypothetical protein
MFARHPCRIRDTLPTGKTGRPAGGKTEQSARRIKEKRLLDAVSCVIFGVECGEKGEDSAPGIWQH